MIIPNWPVPTWVRAVVTTRAQGTLAQRDDADPQQVALNRLRLQQHLNLPTIPFWLNQIHSDIVLKAPIAGTLEESTADGSWTDAIGIPCAVLTADCLPLLLSDEKGTVISALHCGWRGILNGIIERGVESIKPKAQGRLIAWMGPAMGPSSYEVGPEVRALFMQKAPLFAHAFKPLGRDNKWLCDLYELARVQLQALGITAIYGGEYCTYTQSELFYSYRKEKITGRMATLIWLNNH